MKDLTITRYVSDIQQGCRGQLQVDGLRLHTIERPWIDNRPHISCIPTGEYYIEPTESPKYGDVWAIVGGSVSRHKTDYSARFACLFHPANYASQLEGCIAVGRSTGVRDDAEKSWAVWNSKDALEGLVDAVGFDVHRLTIRWGVPTW